MTGASYNRHGSNQVVRTPDALLASVQARFGKIEFDLAASPDNAVAERYYTEQDDALRQDWSKVGLAWCNPPFAKFSKFTAKAASEAKKGARIVMLATAGVSTNWWAKSVEGHAMVIPIKRVRFVGHSADFPKDMVILVYGFGMSGYARQWDWR